MNENIKMATNKSGLRFSDMVNSNDRGSGKRHFDDCSGYIFWNHVFTWNLIRRTAERKRKEVKRMKEYKTNWEKVDNEDVGILVDAVARYVSSTEYPDVNVILSILAIEEVKEK